MTVVILSYDRNIIVGDASHSAALRERMSNALPLAGRTDVKLPAARDRDRAARWRPPLRDHRSAPRPAAARASPSANDIASMKRAARPTGPRGSYTSAPHRNYAPSGTGSSRLGTSALDIST